MQEQPSDGPAVYVIQAEHGGPVKIGFSRRRSGVQGRLSELQIGSPYKLVVRHVFDAPEGVLVEREFHERFAQYRMVGEWFFNAPELAMALHSLLPGTRDPDRILQPLLHNAFNAGVDHGRAMAERESREMFSEFFRRAAGWMFDTENEVDLEVRSAEEALRLVLAHGEADILKRWRRAHHAARHEIFEMPADAA